MVKLQVPRERGRAGGVGAGRPHDPCRQVRLGVISIRAARKE